MTAAPQLVEHFFRHEYGRLVSILSGREGVQHLEDIEDAVQSALMTALEAWVISGVPNNPSAWLFRVVHNDLMSTLRQGSSQRRLLAQYPNDAMGAPGVEPECLMAGEVEDHLLRMLFACCDNTIPAESQLVLALKTLCGFGVREIALRLFTSEANVYKRLARARHRLQKNHRSL